MKKDWRDDYVRAFYLTDAQVSALRLDGYQRDDMRMVLLVPPYGIGRALVIEIPKRDKTKNELQLVPYDASKIADFSMDDVYSIVEIR